MAASKKRPRRSPAMEQFFRAKEQYPDAVLFFRLGDFYEMFYEDAVRTAPLLDITLTSRSKDSSGESVPMAGVPHHSASSYIAKLLEHGQKVAICEQMADPSTVKGVVPREVVRVVTPGLVLDPDALDARASNYLVAVVAGEADYGLAALELSTSELRACTLEDSAQVLSELVRLDPREVLLHDAAAQLEPELRQTLPRSALRPLRNEYIEEALEEPRLAQVLDTASTAATSVTLAPAGIHAAAAALAYAQAAQPKESLQVQRIAPYDPRQCLALDEAAVRNLELVRTLSGEREGSLLHRIDATSTAMGARLLRERLLAPLMDIAAIRRRHDAVDALVMDADLRGKLRDALAATRDLERLATRVSLGAATPRDLAAIRDSQQAAAAIDEALRDHARQTTDDALPVIGDELVVPALRDKLQRALVDQPPMQAGAGGVFRPGYDADLDELRELSGSSKDVILQLEADERERTGIPSLKIRYTRVFGYYIEVTRTHLASVPARYRRKQTVAGGERYVTDELDELQARILHADESLHALEAERFEQLRGEVAEHVPRLRALAARLADLDVHAALAEVAHRHGYIRPEVDDSLSLELREARHPIVEQSVPAGRFVPNDTCLDAEQERLMVITGPNMAGKSTVMRQVALTVILAQAGGFVPAASARVGRVDRVYTRVGASDDVSRGQSTFMLEMRESAAILHGATRRSLVVLDEIGRGTSTYDGLAIAWAMAEHLHDAVGCRVMFATHYHELCELASTREGVVNYNVAAKEHGEEVVFLHRLIPGAANRSYGVAVARLAGLPPIVLARARAILEGLESGSALPSGAHANMRAKDVEGRAQLDLFASKADEPRSSEVEATLRELDVEHLTPVDALVALARLKNMLNRDE